MSATQAITDVIRAALSQSKFTSASPGHINLFIDDGSLQNLQLGGFEEELELLIRREIEKTSKTGGARTVGEREGDPTKELLKATQAGIDPVNFAQQYAKRLVPILLPLLIAAGIGQLILDTSLSPGGILDRRLRRLITQEVNGLLDKQTQKNFSIGTRQLTIQSRAGFRNIQGIGSEDNLRQIREGTGAGLRKSALDYVDFSRGIREIRE